MSERYLFDQSYRLEYGVIAGLDEAGRGPVAGPLVACAVVMRDDFDHGTLNDSKKLTDRVRRQLKPVIEDAARQISLGIVSSSEIDSNRMAWAVRTSFKRAMVPLIQRTDMFLVDGNSVSGLDVPVRFLVRGDSKSLSIAAASVIAKVTRDDMMIEAHRRYPRYGFDRHKGYGTAEHLKIIKDIGPSPIHRMSFAPLSRWYQTGQMSLFPLNAPDTGKAAEQRAARFYSNLGFTLLERNWFSSYGEIDLILRKKGVVYFVEVKSTLSGREKRALQKIDAAKLARIRNAAEDWMAATGYTGECALEAVLVTADSSERFPLHWN
ncbi:MAG: ribonuclease HII [Candidatus Fermentibacteraceae bacterium]|nr:ribonuclease HII [Candidatus Fermentibacteraceae bacterium]